MCYCLYVLFFFFFNDTATTEIYTLSLHDALPIFARLELPITSGHDLITLYRAVGHRRPLINGYSGYFAPHYWAMQQDRKSTRLNSSHGYISYAVFCLKKKKKKKIQK